MRICFYILATFLLVFAVTVAMTGRGLFGNPDPSAADVSVEASLTSDKPVYAVGESINLTFTLTNNGTSPATVVQPSLSPYLVLFDVTGPSGTLPFDGIRQRIRPFSPGNFITLTAGEWTANSFDLTSDYDLTEAGSYTIVAIYRNFDAGARFGLTALTTQGIFSNPIVIQVAAAP